MNRYEPVSDGGQRADDGAITVSKNGRVLIIHGKDWSGSKSVAYVSIPTDLRLCRLVPDNRPRPDWSTAPEWAQWWAVDADGLARWWASRPEIENVSWEEGMDWDKDRNIEIPLGIDWRTLIEKKPEVGDA